MIDLSKNEIIATDDVVWVDVDFTLICPNDLAYDIPDSINKKLVAKIKEWSNNGRTIIVWTSNAKGIEWAKSAVKLCGLEDYVYDCLPKPSIIVDDNHLEYYTTIDPLTFEKTPPRRGI